jgi:hypothetical protein
MKLRVQKVKFNSIKNWVLKVFINQKGRGVVLRCLEASDVNNKLIWAKSDLAQQLLIQVPNPTFKLKCAEYFSIVRSFYTLSSSTTLLV